MRQTTVGHIAPKGILALWSEHGQDWVKTPDRYREVGERILKAGEPLLAYDVLSRGLEVRPQNVRMRQLLALSLARSGATERARNVLEGLRAEGHRDEETLGLLGRTYKDLAGLASHAGEKAALLRKSHACYAVAFSRTRGFYTGVNAATTAFLLGETTIAQTLARDVRGLCLRQLDRIPEKDSSYWLLATLGETSLILRDSDRAQDWYSKAAVSAHGSLAELSSTRRQARLLMDRIPEVDREAVERCLSIPRVAVFTGHMIDAPGALRPRFPLALEGAVREKITAQIRKLGVAAGFASAACGSDILFLEEMLAQGKEVQIVLPVPPGEMRRTSVDFVPGGWGRRFERVLRRATRVHVASELAASACGTDYKYTNWIIDGLARLRAQTLDTEVAALAVLDRKNSVKEGGAGSFVRHWEERGQSVDIIDLRKLLCASGLECVRANRNRSALRVRSKRTGFPQRIVALLFADAVGYSKLMNAQIPLFVKKFLGIAAALHADSRSGAVVRNSWGDGLYFVFDSIEAAGVFALRFNERVMAIDWSKLGLPANLSFRVALHAGPSYPFKNPLTEKPDFTGSHVSRAARIEPVTPPGQVYASQAFAALAVSQGARGFKCEYVGQVPLAKGYGSFPLYHLRKEVV